MARSLLGNQRCRRIPYALVVLALFAFDFLKPTLEAYVGHLYSDATERLVSETVPSSATVAGPHVWASEMADAARRHLEQVYNERMQEYQAHKAEFPGSDRAPPVLRDREVLEEWAMNQKELALMPIRGQLQEGLALSAGMNTINSFYVTAIGLIGLASMVVIAWVVLARVRDIGWPAWTGLAVIGVFLIKVWTLQTVPHLVSMGLQVTFLGLLMVLAFIPPGFDFRRKPEPAQLRPPVTGQWPTPASNHSAARGQFGRRVR